MEGHLVKVCKKISRESQAVSVASILKSAKEVSEATDRDLFIDSGSTDHVIVHKSWFGNLRELDTNATNPDGGNTKVSEIKELDILAKDTQGKLTPLVLKKALFLPKYRTNFVPVSSVGDNGH